MTSTRPSVVGRCCRIAILAGIGALAWNYAVVKSREHEHVVVPQMDPLLNLRPTPSMKATLKYF